MAIQFSTALRNSLRDVYVTAFGTTPGTLVIRTGAPAGVGGAAGGTALATITLPATPFTSGTGAVTLNGTWTDASADATGTAAHYRLTQGTNIEEGTVTATGGGGDLTLDNVSIASGQTVTISTWTRTMPAA
jgi:hypothetical protein